jgi:Na+-translocating ferredoxin:NAD+ oxidoreductase RNF subunit RnfB
METKTKDKIRRIYDTLPKMDCGVCGFDGCGQFARAIAEGRASPFGCKQNPMAGYVINEILGGGVPSPRRLKTAAPEGLRQEIGKLSRRADDILARIEKLRATS